jgi:predicted dehydrogenase
VDAGGSVHATLRFGDASVATISYVTDGSSRFPKETLEVVGDGRNGRLDNFQRVTVWSGKGKNGHRVLTAQDKGQRTQLERFIKAVRTGSAMPISLESLVATTRATLAVESSLSLGRPVSW